MRYLPCDLGVETTDGDSIAIRFDRGELRLSFVDWREEARTILFENVLAFRWQDHDDPELTDGRTLVAVESAWLDRQAKLQLVSLENFSHYVICFNAGGALEVIASAVSVA